MNNLVIYYADLITLAITIVIVLFMVIRRNLKRFKETREHKMHVWIGAVFVLTMVFVHLTDYSEKLTTNINENRFMVWQYIFSIFVQMLFIIHFLKRINK